MPSLYDLKPGFQRMLGPLCVALHRLGVTPNIVTVAAAVASVAYGAWMLLGADGRLPYLLLPLFMFARMALNAVDGMLARQYDAQSKEGFILNELGDVVSDAVLILPFAALPEALPATVIGAALLALLTEFAGVLGLVIGAGRRYDGPLGKSDRAFVLGALGLAIGTVVPPHAWLNLIFLSMNVLLAWTIWNRVRHALRGAR